MLRRVINWFVNPNSVMAEAIYNNIRSLTGEDAREVALGFKRTGSGLHRFIYARQSSGGFAAVMPNLANHMIMTSDTLCYTSLKNYDFMYQFILLKLELSHHIPFRKVVKHTTLISAAKNV